MPYNTFVIVQTRFTGLHHYPHAPDEVLYLREAHRHEFYVTVEIEVFHDDRELEFVMVKNKIHEILANNPKIADMMQAELGKSAKCPTLSCEQIARIIKDTLHQEYGEHRKISVTVMEDGENGAIIRDW